MLCLSSIANAAGVCLPKVEVSMSCQYMLWNLWDMNKLLGMWWNPWDVSELWDLWDMNELWDSICCGVLARLSQDQLFSICSTACIWWVWWVLRVTDATGHIFLNYFYLVL